MGFISMSKAARISSVAVEDVDPSQITQSLSYSAQLFIQFGLRKQSCNFRARTATVGSFFELKDDNEEREVIDN